MIDEKQIQKDSFEFKPTNQEIVTKIIDKFNPKKATVADKISVKLLKLAKKHLSRTYYRPHINFYQNLSPMVPKEPKLPLCLRKIML